MHHTLEPFETREGTILVPECSVSKVQFLLESHGHAFKGWKRDKVGSKRQFIKIRLKIKFITQHSDKDDTQVNIVSAWLIWTSPLVDLYLISEKSIWKNPVLQTGFLVYFELNFYCLCSLQESISKFVFEG